MKPRIKAQIEPRIEQGGFKPRIFEGIVIKKSGDKTVKVAVERFVRHPIYKKQYKVTKYYLVDDSFNRATVGQTVKITETKPTSKRKHFRIV